MHILCGFCRPSKLQFNSNFSWLLDANVGQTKCIYFALHSHSFICRYVWQCQYLIWQAIHHSAKSQHCILPAIMTATLFIRIRANHTGPCASAPVPVLYRSLFSPLPKRGAICMTASTLCMLMMLLPAAQFVFYRGEGEERDKEALYWLSRESHIMECWMT